MCGRLLRYNAMDMTFKTFKLRRDPSCPVCGDHPTIDRLIDYEQFCGIRGEESNTIIRDEKNMIPEISVKQLKRKIDNGDAFELSTNLVQAFVDGRRIALTDKQVELDRKYRTKYRQLGLIE